MLTGKRAFEGKSQLSVASAILDKEPEPITSTKLLAPVALNRAIKKCLEKSPAEASKPVFFQIQNKPQ